MALASVSRPAPFGAIATYAAIGSASSLIESIVEWNAQRKTIRELSALSDRQLDDIGITRSDLNNGFTRV